MNARPSPTALRQPACIGTIASTAPTAATAGICMSRACRTTNEFRIAQFGRCGGSGVVVDIGSLDPVYTRVRLEFAALAWAFAAALLQRRSRSGARGSAGPRLVE